MRACVLGISLTTAAEAAAAVHHIRHNLPQACNLLNKFIHSMHELLSKSVRVYRKYSLLTCTVRLIKDIQTREILNTSRFCFVSIYRSISQYSSSSLISSRSATYTITIHNCCYHQALIYSNHLIKSIK